jgi:23S rRNA pseudouridine1911/1915/1917 synthase
VGQIQLLCESDDYLAVYKPEGLSSSPVARGDTDTAADQAFSLRPELRYAGPKPLEGGLLHRLDRETSGVLLFAKTPHAFECAREIWKTERVEKIYRAWVTPPWSAPTPALHEPHLSHSRKSQKRMLVVSPKTERSLRGRPLPTWTCVLQARTDGEKSELTLQIRTGVLHQIRCTLASLGHPILGDPVYRGDPSTRLWLHAWKIRIPAPGGAVFEAEAPLPPTWLEPKA